MKQIIFTLIFLIAFFTGIKAQSTHTINVSGLSFSPSNLSITVGNKVIFNGNSSHPITEVSMETYNANDNTPLSGGFSFSTGVGEKVFNTVGTYYYICQNHYSSGMKGKINVSAVTSVDNLIDSKELSIFPNPLNKDFLTISYYQNSSSNIAISIYDITGKSRIFKSERLINNQIVIDCSDLISGIYIVQINIDNKITSSKLVKK